MLGFTLVWLGQIVSVLATQRTVFAPTIWVFGETGSATALGLLQVFFITPLLVMTSRNAEDILPDHDNGLLSRLKSLFFMPLFEMTLKANHPG
jgi:hypothetical protein